MSDPTPPSPESVPPAAPAQWPAAPAASEAVPVDAPAPAVIPDAGPAPAVPAPGGPAQWPAAAPLPPPGVPAAPKTSSNAVIALVLAVASWAICPIAPAIVSLVFASMAAKEIAASEGRVDGSGLVLASRIVSWINIGLWTAFLVIGAFVLVIVAIAGGFSSSR